MKSPVEFWTLAGLVASLLTSKAFDATYLPAGRRLRAYCTTAPDRGAFLEILDIGVALTCVEVTRLLKAHSFNIRAERNQETML